MNVSEMPAKVAVTVSEMAAMCLISRSRWYEMVDAGVFPKPIRLASVKRPVYDRELIAKCLEIRATGIGLSGPVLFNRRSKKAGQPKAKPLPPVKTEGVDPAIEPIVDAVKALGVTTTPQAVCDAVAVLYPSGIAGQNQGEVIRKTFLHLQGKRP
jgi:predicted DNA-binding transcriptional regulator AlpA